MNPQAAQHLCKLLGMLGSSHDGEVESAGRKAHNFIRQLNVTWPEIIHAPATSWRRMAIACANQRHLLNERERDFINNVVRLRWPPTDKRLAWLESIYSRLQREVA
jgi:hypothetical protein